MKTFALIIGLVFGVAASAGDWVSQPKAFTQSIADLKQSDDSVRFATFNISFNRKTEGHLKEELAKGKSINARRIAEIIQRVRPDVVLLNEFDYDPEGEAVAHFAAKFLAVSQNRQEPIQYKYTYFQTVNTGVDSGLDLNNDGELGTGNDAFGFGAFPGQYGMVVLSRFEIDRDNVRTFQNFLWKDMPENLWPIRPGSNEPYYSETIKKVFRLSSKSHWDVPIKVGQRTIHLLAAHPTPPVFDEDEDRNGRRNHDEIRLFADYIRPGKSGYLYDDQGRKGGLPEGSHFVIAGDMNADQWDGDSSMNSANQFTDHPLINHAMTPKSNGGIYYAKEQGKVNEQQKGDPAYDTSDFNDNSVGNLHLDYCLPSKTLTIKNSGVFWPRPDEPGSGLVVATDHRLVWIDILK